MTATEFSSCFDILYNNIDSNSAPDLNDYEKSVFLTLALEEVIRSYFAPVSDPLQQGFDGSTKRQADFSMLLDDNQAEIDTSNSGTIDKRALVTTIPKEVLLVVNELLLINKVSDGSTVQVRQIIPITSNEYRRLMSKPFHEPLKSLAWRLTNSGISTSGNVNAKSIEIVTTSSDTKNYKNENYKFYYSIRYVKRPRPIILSDFTVIGQGITIQGETGHTGYDFSNPCELDPILHDEILRRAVEIAKAAWVGAFEVPKTRKEKDD